MPLVNKQWEIFVLAVYEASEQAMGNLCLAVYEDSEQAVGNL